MGPHQIHSGKDKPVEGDIVLQRGMAGLRVGFGLAVSPTCIGAVVGGDAKAQMVLVDVLQVGQPEQYMPPKWTEGRRDRVR